MTMAIAAMLSVTSWAQDTIIISEYIEGSSNNKALELYNPGTTEVDLANYQIAQAVNGRAGWEFFHIFADSATIPAGGFYVLTTDQIDPALYDTTNADEVLGFPSPIHYNGDDARAIIHISGSDTTIIDVFGDPNNDPGSGWDVAGEAGVTANATLLRKPGVVAGNTTALGSFGTTPGTSEWYVLPQNDFSNLGMATPTDPVSGPDAPELPENLVFSVFSDTYGADATVDTWRTGWSVAAFADTTIDGNAVKRYTNLDFVGVETVANQIDLAGMTHVRFDVWTPQATQLRFKLVDAGANGTIDGAGSDDVEHEITVTDPVQGEWVTYDVPLSAFTGLTTSANIAQHIFAAQPAGGATVYLDNYFFYDSATVADTRTVTFNVNTATIPDTLSESGFVQIRGNLIAAGTYGSQNVTWDAGSTPVASNMGGDYWSVDVEMAPGDSLVYKYYAGLSSADGDGVNGDGWEANGPFNNNYLFVLPETATADTVLDLVYFNSGNGRGAPFESKEDSIAVWFRVNVGSIAQTGDFDPETDSIQVRGGQAPLTWDASTGVVLSREAGGTGDNIFYSGVGYFPVDSLPTFTPNGNPAPTIGYKYYAAGPEGEFGWETFGGDRFSLISTTQDTTLGLQYFNRTKPTAGTIVSTTLNFEVNMGILEGLQLFNSGLDGVQVRGQFNNFGDVNPMSFNDVSGNFEALGIPYTGAEGATLEYKYFIDWDESRFNEESENFLEGINPGAGWEEPGVTAGGNRSFSIVNEAAQPTQQEFINGVEPQALLTPVNVDGGSITVTFSIDMTAATTRNDGVAPFNTANDSLFLFVDTPFFALTNDITVPGDDGSNFIGITEQERSRLQFTDPDGDMIYTLDLELVLPTLNHIGFRVAYGEPTSETGQLIVNGAGFEAGRRYYQYIQPIVAADGDDFDDLPDVSWPATFAFPTLTWTATDLAFETPPDYSTITTNSETEEMVERFTLEQNYPNPFNPTTNISFTLPTASNVNLTVYNLLGQRVATLIDGRTMTSGAHTVAFDARNLASGVYIYRIEAGSFVSNKRMTLIK
jgi:hypothetical protein